MYLIQLLYTFYSILAGYNDAVLYGRKGAASFSWNEHALFVIERVILVCLPLATSLTHPSLWRQACDALVFALLYSLLHNTSYYHARNQIDGSQHNPFTYQSPTSSAKHEYGPKVRWLLGGLGLVALVLGSIFLPR